MSKISVPALYQTETFSSGFGRNPFRQETKPDLPRRPAAAGIRPRKEPDFLVQLIASVDPDFSNNLGRRDVARSREAAYAFAAAHRTSQLPAAPVITRKA